jgi:hypothetical protein
MTQDEALKLLTKRRSPEWNDYRNRNPSWVPDLIGSDLTRVDLVPSDLPPFDLSGALLLGTVLSKEMRHFVFQGNRVKLEGALIDADTLFPSTFDPIAAGARFVTKSEISGVNGSPPPFVFLSYAWSDEEVVLAIDQWLRLKRVRTKIDRRDFFAGARIRDEII